MASKAIPNITINVSGDLIIVNGRESNKIESLHVDKEATTKNSNLRALYGIALFMLVIFSGLIINKWDRIEPLFAISQALVFLIKKII